MTHSAITFLILGGAVVLFVSSRVPVALVAIGVALSLWATGVLTLDQSLAGFGDPTVLFIASLFVVSEAMNAAGVTAWVGQLLLARVGTDRRRIVVSVMIICALITALISVNGAVAALLPVVVVIALRVRQPSSQLLIPLAFGAHAGALLALTGSPVNVLVSDAAAEAGVGSFGFFAFALVGIPLLVGTIAITLALGPRLLPHRNAKIMPADFSKLAPTLVRDYELGDEADGALYSREQGVAEVIIPPRSGLVGQTAFPGMVTESGDLVVLAIQRDREPLGPGEVVLAGGDSLLLRGTWTALSAHLNDDNVLTVNEPDQVRRQIVPLGLGAKEALVVLAIMVLLLATGAAGLLADHLVAIVAGAGPYALLAGLFILTAVLGQLISNTATALIVIPIAISSATELSVSPRPVLMAVNVAAAATFLTPVATPANMMVMQPGGYRFGDYWRLGLPLLAWFGVISIGLVPLIWRF